jgi:low temperature requirement protein LtrA
VLEQATFVLLILGEAIIALVQSNTESNHDINYFLRGLMGFGLVFNVGDVYYQQQVVGRIAFYESPKSKPITLWTALHLFLSISILYFAVGLKLVFNAEGSEGRIQKYEYLLCWSASATLSLIFLIRMTHKGIRYKGKRVRWFSYMFRFGICILCTIIPLFSEEALFTIGTLFGFSSLLVLQVNNVNKKTVCVYVYVRCICLY